MSRTQQVAWKVRANYWTGWRAVGGRLSLGVEELSFEPHALDRILRGRGFRAPLREIVAVEVRRQGGFPRKRMFVRTRDGVESVFLVPHVEERASQLLKMISDYRGE